MNKFMCKGFLGKDPELKQFPDGTAVVNFSIADTQKWKNKTTGERQERTEWFRMVATGKRAEVIAKYFSKGSEILIVDSQFRQREYEKDGVKHYMSEFKVSDFEFCGSGNGGGEKKVAQQAKDYAPENNPPQMESFAEDSEIPF